MARMTVSKTVSKGRKYIITHGAGWILTPAEARKARKRMRGARWSTKELELGKKVYRLKVKTIA